LAGSIARSLARVDGASPRQLALGGHEEDVIDDFEFFFEDVHDVGAYDALVFTRCHDFRGPTEHDLANHIAAAAVGCHDRDIPECVEILNRVRDRLQSRLELSHAQYVARDCHHALERSLSHDYLVGRSPVSLSSEGVLRTSRMTVRPRNANAYP